MNNKIEKEIFWISDIVYNENIEPRDTNHVDICQFFAQKDPQIFFGIYKKFPSKPFN